MNEESHDGTGRVELSFTVQDADPERTAQRQVRVPPGVTVFDSASWNGAPPTARRTPTIRWPCE